MPRWSRYSAITPQTVALCVVLAASAMLLLLRTELMGPALWTALSGSLRRMLIGYVVVSTTGVLIGILLAQVKWVEQVMASLAVALNAIPGAAWVPLSILWFGMTERAVIFTIFLGAIGIVVISTHTGIIEVPPLIKRAAWTMGASGMKYFWAVAVPSAVPKIVDGLRLAWAFGWRALMAGELFTSVIGLGKILSDAGKAQDMNQLVGLMLLVASIGVAVDALIKVVQHVVRERWGLT
jgi:NitT/TauT family transport system permease protein